MTPRVVVSGPTGRLGRRIVLQAAQDPKVELAGLWVRPGGDTEGRELGELFPELSDHPRAALRARSRVELGPETVLVETAPPPGALPHLDLARAAGAPVVMATTGFRSSDERTFEAAAGEIPLLLAPNLSLGVNLLLDLVARASKALAHYDLEVLELHHRRKRDAPSGTAWALGRTAAAARGIEDFERAAIFARAGDVGPRSDAEVGMFAIRGGDIVGEHTVYLVGEHERVELTHRAGTRDAFAEGAVVAAQYLAGKPPGRYRMADVLGLA